MADFAEYYIEFLTKLFQNIGVFFKTIGIAIADIFRYDIPEYIADLQRAAGEFGALGWITYILVTLINLVCVFFILYRLFQLLRRYVFFRAKEVEKDELMEALAVEKEKVAQLTIEKNQLYAMKAGVVYPGGREPEKAEVKQLPATRFNKLTAIDLKYADMAPFISNAEAEGLTLSALVEKFVAYAASQLRLYYRKEIVREFFAGMATTKVLIIEGISGTGKTSLPYAMGKFFSSETTLVSVQPSWRDRADLVGYLNEFTKTFNETEFMGALYEATYREDPSFIVLDELNLARIEYYFAEFLSVMEMPDPSEWTLDIVPTSEKGDPKHIVDGKILVPQGLWFIGTANQDDSTFTITDKVYDRTVTIDINEKGQYFDAPLAEGVRVSYDYLELLFGRAVAAFKMSDKTAENLRLVDEFIFEKFKITFGNRIMRQIGIFVPVYVACGGTETEAVDFMLMSKILRKFNALNIALLKKELTELNALLDKLFGKNKCEKSIAFIKKLARM